MTNRDELNVRGNAAQLLDIILDAKDADLLLRHLYNGQKPVRVHTLFCSCHATADRRSNPDAWNGWQVLPHPKCPNCLARQGYPSLALARFSRMVSMLGSGKSLPAPAKDGEA